MSLIIYCVGARYYICFVVTTATNRCQNQCHCPQEHICGSQKTSIYRCSFSVKSLERWARSKVSYLISEILTTSLKVSGVERWTPQTCSISVCVAFKRELETSIWNIHVYEVPWEALQQFRLQGWTGYCLSVRDSFHLPEPWEDL